MSKPQHTKNIWIENVFTHYGLILFIALSFILYGNSIKNQYALDDDYVINNDVIKQGVSAIPDIFTSYYSGNEKEQYGYRPITRSLFALEYSVFGNNSKAFHFFNILWYALLCWLLFSTFSKFLKDVPKLIFLVSALLFLFHPVHTEVVNSLKNREEILCFILSLLSLRFFLLYQSKNKVLYALAGGLLLYLAYLTKETALAFAFIIPLFMLFTKSRNITIIVSTLIAAVFVFLAYKTPGWILPPAASHVEEWQNPLFAFGGESDKLPLVLLSLEHYLWLLIFPLRLLFYYGYNMIPAESFFSFHVLLSLLINVALLVLAVLSFKKNKGLSLGIFFFFFAIGMFINLVVPITGIVGDRLVFMASWGFCLIIAAAFYSLSEKLRLKKYMPLILIAVLFLYGAKTISRNTDWKNVETLYEADLPYLEQSVKANDLYASFLLKKAEVLIKNGRKPAELTNIIDKSLKHFKKAVEILPRHYNAWNNLGSMYLLYYNDTANAVYAINNALDIKPDLVIARHNLGYIYYKSNKLEPAKKEFEKVFETDSLYVPSLFSYAEILTLEKNYSEAEKRFKTILSVDSLNTPSLFNLGSIYIVKQDTAEAIKYYEKALIKDKSNKALIMSIADYYSKKGDAKKSKYYRSLSGL